MFFPILCCVGLRLEGSRFFYHSCKLFELSSLPSYNQVGAISVVFLILIRILQGLSVGGQLMSSLVFTLEGHPVEHWGVYGSFVMAAANFGTLLGNLVATVLEASLTPQQLETWGWRIPFLSGISTFLRFLLFLLFLYVSSCFLCFSSLVLLSFSC